MKLKPSKVDIHWCFKCPVCTSEYWFSHQDIIAGKNITCCGTNYGEVRIHTVKLDYQMGKKPSDPSQNHKNTNIDLPINTLVGLGYSRRQAQTMIQSVITTGNATNPNILVKLALAGDKHVK